MADSLSTNPLGPPLSYAAGSTKHVPFKVYLRYVPYASGRRWEGIRDKQKVVNSIESELVDAEWEISTPISMVPGLRGYITIVGTYPLSRDTNPNVDPLTEASRIHPGSDGEATSVHEGHADVNGGLTDDRVPTTDFLTEMEDFKAALESASPTLAASTRIEKIEFEGIRFGKGGRTFPT
jgi:hypothetical protein